jgi:hypothetical protein
MIDGREGPDMGTTRWLESHEVVDKGDAWLCAYMSTSSGVGEWMVGLTVKELAKQMKKLFGEKWVRVERSEVVDLRLKLAER